jgi:predicted nucleic acid-binding protein
LLVAECANVLWKKARRTELNTDEARLAAGLLQRAISTWPQCTACSRGRRGSQSHWTTLLTIASVSALAEGMGSDLVTADQRLSAKALAADVKPKVLALMASTLP